MIPKLLGPALFALGLATAGVGVHLQRPLAPPPEPRAANLPAAAPRAVNWALELRAERPVLGDLPEPWPTWLMHRRPLVVEPGHPLSHRRPR